MTNIPFDENSLRADIVKVWGENGAHIDVFDHMLKTLREVQVHHGSDGCHECSLGLGHHDD